MSSTPQQMPGGTISQGEAIIPHYTLFDANAVTLATFFGTPVAGASLMLINDRRLERGGRGLVTLLAAIAVTGLAVLAGWNIPQGVSSVFALVLVILMGQAARTMQGAAVKEHVQRGGRLGSKWSAFGVGLGFLAAIFAAVFLAVFVPAYRLDHGPKVIVGSKDEIYYYGTATQAEARALGSALKSDGYFEDAGVTVLLDKGLGGTVVSFVVKEGLWDQPATVSIFEEMGREVAGSVGGLPLKVRLIDKMRAVKKESTVGRAEFGGKDHVYYLGSATVADAQALGHALQTAGFFSGKGVDVFLTRHSDGTTLAFVVGDGVWNDAEMVASFESIARNAAPTVGGLPVHLRLESTTLDTKKDETLH